MRIHLSLCILLLSLPGCSGSGTAPTETVPSEPDRLVIQGGNFQAARVTERLANDLVVTAREGAQSVEGVLVCFVATTKDAGEPFVPCASTNGVGEARTPWDLGTLAGNHSVEARAMVDGEPVVAATFALEALPGPAAHIEMPDHWIIRIGEEEDFALRTNVTDAYGNALPRDVVTFAGAEGGVYVAEIEAWDTITATAEEISRSMPITALQEIGGSWTYTLRCGAGSLWVWGPPYNRVAQLDSAFVAIVADLAVAIPTSPEEGYVVRSGISGTVTRRYWFPGVEEAHELEPWKSVWALDQRPGAINLQTSGVDLSDGTGRVWTLLTAEENPPQTYLGEGAICGTAPLVEESFRAPS